MKFYPLSISGYWKVGLQKFGDNCGYFYESFKDHGFRKGIGRNFSIKQVSNSASSKGTLRGIHHAQVPPSS